MEYTFYAFWNGEQIYDILNAVVLVTGGSQGDAYRQLMTSIALIAILVSTGVGLAKLRATDTVTAFMALTFFYGIFFVPTATVHIDDVRKNQQYTVANVPLGLALFGGMTSHIGYWLTNVYETNFTSVDDEKFSQYGFLFGSRLVEELPKQEYTDPLLKGNLGEFSKSCILPELVDYPGKINGLVSAPDIWVHITTAGWINPGRVATYVDPATGVPQFLDCDQAATALGVDTLAGAARQLKYLSDTLHPGDPAAPATMAGQLSAFETTMLGITRAADQTLRHYAMMNVIRHSSENSAGIVASTFAAAQLETSYLTMKTVAEGALPKIRNLVESLIYAVFPIVFLIVIAAGALGGKVLSMYAMTAVWIHLWAPLYAVINSFMHRASTEAYLQLVESGGGTIENMSHLAQMTVSDQGMAGLMVISVPAIALAIVKGGAVAMSGVVNSLMSPGQSMAAKTGGEIGMGNISGARVNWGGASFDSSLSQTSAQTKLNTPHGQLTYDEKGGMSGFNPNPMSSAGASIKAERQDGGRVTNASTSGDRGSQGRFAGYENANQAGFSAQDSAEFGRRLETGLSSRLGAEFHDNLTDGTGRHVGGDSRTGSGSSLSTDEAARMRSQFGFGGNGRDESSISKDGRSSTSYTQPGGGGRGTPGGGGMGAGDNALAKAGSVGPDTKHDNSRSRGQRVAGMGVVNADVGVGAEASQRLSDIIKNENGQFTRNEQLWAAQTLAGAVNDVMKNTTDQGIRSAGQKFMADNGFSTRATEGERSTSENYLDSGQRIESFGGGTVGGSLTSERPVIDAARAMVQEEGFGTGPMADMEAMRRLHSDEGFRAEAVARASANYGSTADPVTGLSDMSAPLTGQQVSSLANKWVDAANTRGNDQVEQTKEGAERKIGAAQPFSPNSMPDTTRAENAFAAVSLESGERRTQQGEQAAFVAGSNNLAAQLYESNERGMSTVASVAYLGGLGYDSPSDYSQAINKAANEDPGLRAEIAQYANGQRASEEDLDRIFNKVADKL